REEEPVVVGRRHGPRHVAEHVPGGHDVQDGEPGDGSWVIEGQAMRDAGAAVVADQLELLEAEPAHEPHLVLGHRPLGVRLPGGVRLWLAAVAVAPQVSQDDRVVFGQGGGDVAPHEVVLGVAMQHEHGRTRSRGGTVDGDAVDVDAPVLEPGQQCAHGSPHSRASRMTWDVSWPTSSRWPMRWLCSVAAASCGGWRKRRCSSRSTAAVRSCQLAGGCGMSWESATASTSRSALRSRVCRSVLVGKWLPSGGSSSAPVTAKYTSRPIRPPGRTTRRIWSSMASWASRPGAVHRTPRDQARPTAPSANGSAVASAWMTGAPKSRAAARHASGSGSTKTGRTPGPATA